MVTKVSYSNRTGRPAPHSGNPQFPKPYLIPVHDIAAGEADLHWSKKLQLISEREGEDAILTGGTRSLHRRLLALNVHEAQRTTASRVTGPVFTSQPLSA